MHDFFYRLPKNTIRDVRLVMYLTFIFESFLHQLKNHMLTLSLCIYGAEVRDR